MMDKNIVECVKRLERESRVGYRSLALLEAECIKSLLVEPDNKAYLRQYALSRQYRERGE